MNTLMTTQTRDLTWDYVCDLESQRDELLAALRGLMEYVGGWDAAPDHPCGIARAAIAKVQA
jgi:hypothetical protein